MVDSTSTRLRQSIRCQTCVLLTLAVLASYKKESRSQSGSLSVFKGKKQSQLGNDLGDSGAPVCQLSTSVAAPEVAIHECCIGAALVDVFAGDPDGIAVAGRCSIIAPTWAGSECGS